MEKLITKLKRLYCKKWKYIVSEVLCSYIFCLRADLSPRSALHFFSLSLTSLREV